MIHKSCQPTVDTRANGAASLQFRSLQLPRDHSSLSAADSQLSELARAVGVDAACSVDGQAMVYAGFRDGQAQLLAPFQSKNVGLPIRLGEKVLWTLQIPAVRLVPMAQEGISSERDALELFCWLRVNEPDRAVALTDVSIDSPLYSVVKRGAEIGYVVTRNEPDAHLFHRFCESYEEYFKLLGSKYRNQLRKKEKVFGERLGTDYDFKEYRSPEEVPGFLKAAKSINRKTYQFRMFGEAIDDDDVSVAVTRRAAIAGAFRSFILWHGDIPLCFILGYQYADGTFEHCQTGYDPEWRDVAPGIVSNILLLKRLYAHERPRLLNFGSGDSDYKRLFSNEARTTAGPVLLPRRPRFLLAYGLYGFSSRSNAAIVSLLERWGIKDWLKRRLRGAG